MSFITLDKKIAMGRIPQTNYTTKTAAAANSFVEQVAVDPASSYWNIEPAAMNNKGQGTGNRFATESWIEKWDSSVGFSIDASSQNLGRHLLAALGAVLTAAQGTGYKHTFTPLDTTLSPQLPAYTFVEKLAEGSNGIDSLFPSAVCESLELAGDGLGRVQAAVQYRGSGKEESGAAVVWDTHVQEVQGSQNYFFASQADIEIEGADVNCDLESWRFKYANALSLDGGYRPGCPEYVVAGDPESGVVRTECLLQDSSIEFDFTARLKASDPNLARLKAQTPLTGSIKIEGALISGSDHHALNINFYLMKYRAHVRGEKDGIAAVTITPEVLYSQSDSGIVQVELVNDVTSYTT